MDRLRERRQSGAGGGVGAPDRPSAHPWLKPTPAVITLLKATSGNALRGVKAAAFDTRIDAGFSAQIAPYGAPEIEDGAASGRPDEVAARLVHAGHPPTLLRVEEEELERCFLRLVGMDGGDAP